MSPAAIVLCGGRSTRMGRAKAWLPWRGRPMIAHVVDSLRKGGAVDEVMVVTSAHLALPPLEAAIVCDREPALGPLAGIREGLSHMHADRAYVTSTDAPFLTPLFVDAMLACGDSAAPEVDGYVQTLAAVYPRRALAKAEELLAQHELRPRRLLEAVGYRKVPGHELPDIESIRGFNTAAEYLHALAQDAPGATALLELRGDALQATAQREWEIPVGTLAQALSHVPGLNLLTGKPSERIGDSPHEISTRFSVSLASGESIRDARIPIGPGERVIVTDATT